MAMTKDDLGQFFAKKAYEISYAGFRIAEAVESASLSEGIMRVVTELLGTTVRGKYGESIRISKELEYLLRLAGDTGVLARDTALIILGELERFVSLLRESAEKTETRTPMAVDLEGIFSTPPLPQSPEAMAREDEGQPTTASQLDKFPAGRRSAILEVIRQLNGNCRLKDIQDALPGMSDRTLRYDVQSLINQGMIERVGSGGPYTRYQLARSKAFQQNGTL